MNSNEDWEKVKLDNIGEIVTGKTPSTKNKDNFGEKYLFITPRDMNGQKNIFKTERMLSEKGLDSVNSHYITGNSICVSCIGTIGKIVMVNKKAITNQQINSLTNIRENYNIEFIYYMLTLYKKYLHNIAGGTTMPILNKTDFSNVEVPIPKISVQNQISSILASLDKKIKNNNKMNKTLEEIAQAIYKNWFVDFEPFEEEEFVESELGMIPKGWEVKRLKEIVSLKNGKRPNEKKDESEKNFNIPVVGASGVMAYTENSLYDEPILVVGRVGTLGVVQRYNSPCWTSDNTIVIKTDYYEYVYQILKTINFKSLNRGSTQPLIAQKDIKSQKIVFPPKNILKEFSDIVSKLFKKVKNSKRENQTLKKIRDSLLPKLMSGEIKVPLDKDEKEVK